jgi:hypothetical protein
LGPRHALLGALALLLAASAPALAAPREVGITVNPAVTYQTMRGWEVHAEGAEPDSDQAAFPNFINEVADRAVNEVGIDRVRLEIRSGVENTDRNWERFRDHEYDEGGWKPLRYATVNDDNDPHHINWAGFDFAETDAAVVEDVLPLKARLEARGERLFVNVCYVAFTQQIRGGAYVHDDPEEYAEFVLATYLHLKAKFGFVPDSWEVILEPDNGIKQWKDGQTIGRAMVATARRLKENGFTPHFVVPSTMNLGEASRYFDEMAQVPGALTYVSEVSYHRYRDATPANLGQIAKRARDHGLDTSMLELWFGYATYGVLHEDLKDGRNSAWQVASLKNLFEIDIKDPKHPKVTLRDYIRMNLQYFRYVRSGAVRIGAKSGDEFQFDPLAFVNKDGAQVVVIKADDGGGAVAVKGLAPGRYRVSYATKEVSVQPPGVLTVAPGEALHTAIPAAGVLTIFDDRLSRFGPPAPAAD